MQCCEDKRAQLWSVFQKDAVLPHALGVVNAVFEHLTPEKDKKQNGQFFTPQPLAQALVKMLNPQIIEEKVPHFAEKLRQEHHPQDWEEVMNKTANMMLNMAKGAKLTNDDFKKIHQPVVIGIGSLDTMVSYSESEHVSNLLPNSTLIQLEGVKHPIEKVDIDVLVDYIRAN